MNGFASEGFCVSPRTRKEIAQIAETVRNMFSPSRTKFLDVVDLLERKLPAAFERFSLEIVEDNELPDREAEMCPSSLSIRVRESVYGKAMDGDCHCRFTLAHEIGHFFLHRFQSLAFGLQLQGRKISAYCDSEWQANTFARHFLVPDSLAKGLDVSQIELLFGVSSSVARIVCKGDAPCSGYANSPIGNQPLLPGFDFGNR